MREGAITADLLELKCPACGYCFSLIGFPTLEECRANWNMLSPTERKSVEQAEAFRREFASRKLMAPAQLPEINDPAFVLEWDKSGNETIIRRGERVFFTEPAVWEGYERFIKVAEILRSKYGNAIYDLVPTPASEMYLFGDRLASPGIVEAARKRIFGTDRNDASLN
jgi:hypothetical protein